MSNVNEQELRSYLLGALTPERRTEMENLARADDNLREELLALEEELVDQYLAGELTDDESRSFEAHVLTTERGKRQLHFAQLFERYRNSNPAVQLAVHSVPAPNHPPIPASSPLFATFYRNPTFAVLSIFVAGLLIALVGWLLVAPSRGTSIAENISPQKVVVLVGDKTRPGGMMNHLYAPAGNFQIKLELELTKADFTKYKMKLVRGANETIETQEELKTEPRDTHYFIPVVVTSEKLTPGDYQLKLCGVLESGQPSTIDNYSFRVTDTDVQMDQPDRLAR